MNYRYFVILILSLFASLPSVAKEEPVAPSYAWRIIPPLGLHQPSTIDTLVCNYSLLSVPSLISPAWITTGNLGSQGENMIYFDRKPTSEFFFNDALRAWLPSIDNMKFYNTRIPMTLLSYNTGGNKENAQERLKMTFSGNANRRLQIGANLDFIYSPGMYNYQAVKDLIWGFSASYIADRYQLQMFYNHWNMLNKENGGITDDLYITDPAELQGGVSTIEPRAIPTNLSAAHTKVVGGQLYINNRYNLGFWRELPIEIDDNDEDRDTDNDNDSIKIDKEFVPVTSIIWTAEYNDGKHIFRNDNSKEDSEFWQNQYISLDGTHDRTTFSSIKNTVGLSLLEGFNKWAKAGLSAFITHEHRSYRQTTDTIPLASPSRPEALTPYPYDSRIAPKQRENLAWVGGQLTKQQGSILNYEVTAKFGLLGRAIGEVLVDGTVSTHFRLLGDTVTLSGYGRFANEAPSYLIDNYVSNHFIWHNDFDKTRRTRFGGELKIPHTRTSLNVGVENVQNLIYFNSSALPAQAKDNIQVFSARVNQDFKAGILNWQNSVIFQTSSDSQVIPLPRLTVYSNLYLLFKVAKVLDVQFGVDCDYYTSYYAPSYQPATEAFYCQRDVKCGNYPFMDAYINMKLSKARFYVMFSHFNQGLFGGNNYFSMPHYPLNPRRFQLGVSVDFKN